MDFLSPNTNGESQSETTIAMDPILLMAAVKGNIQPLLETTQHLEQIIAPQSDDTVLHAHIKSSKASNYFVETILNRCPSLLLRVNAKGDIPLHVAAKCGHSNIVQVLLKRARERDSMLRMENDDGNTALDEALRHGKFDVVKIIKDVDPDFLYSSHSLSEILYLAIVRGDYEMVVALIAKKQSLESPHEGSSEIAALDPAIMNPDNIPGTQSNDTILHIHIKSSLTSTDFVEKILNKYPTLLLKGDDQGDTPLHVAAKRGHSNIATVLIRHAKAQCQDHESGLRAALEMLKVKNKNGKTTLDEAVQSQKIEVVKILIKEADPDLSYFANNLLKILYLAAKRGDYETVVALNNLRSRESVAHKGPTQMTVLHAALMNFDVQGTQQKDTILHFHIKFSWRLSTEFVEMILDIYPSLLVQVNAKGDSLLHVAAKYGHSSIVEALLKCARDQPLKPKNRERDNNKLLMMTNINEKNTALHLAVQYGKIDVVRILKEADPTLSYGPNNFGETPLCLAAERGDIDMVVATLGSNGSLSHEDPGISSRDTILQFHIKSQRPSIEFVKKILDKFPKLLLQVDDKGDSPLHVAAKCGQYAIGEALLKCARDQSQEPGSRERAYSKLLRMANNEKNTALHEAVRYGKIDMVKLLTKSDRSFSYSPNKSGESPLYLAVLRGHYKIVVELLENCKSVGHEGPNGMTALHAAVMRSHRGIITKILEKKGTLTKATDEYGWTPLHYAAYHGLKDQVSLLLKSDKYAAYIRDRDRMMTALHMAASQGHKDIVEKIISQCVECCEIEDKKRWNVLHYAMLGLSKNELNDLLKNLLVGNLINKKDIDGNTPLHIRAVTYRDSFFHVGNRQALNNKNIKVEQMLKHGSYELEEEIQKLFEDVGKGQYSNGVIRERKDDQYFKDRVERRKKYYNGLKETKSSHLLVATLIATVTFTAAFTIPGGYDSEASKQGTAILNKNLAFQIFVITDTIAMTLSLSAVVVHFIMSFHKFQRHENLLILALWLTMFATVAVVVAFVTGIYSVLAPSSWLAIATCSLGLSFFCIVLCSLKLIYWRVFRQWREAVIEVFLPCTQRMVVPRSSCQDAADQV